MYTFEVVYGVSKFIDLVAAADENLAILEKHLERQERMKYLISKLNDVPSGFAARNMERICEYETDMSIVRIFSEWANDNQEAFEELKKAFDMVNAILGVNNMTHAVNAAIIRYYKVYVEDEECSMTDAEVEQKAREMILDDQDDALCEDEELEIEPDDIVSMQYGYSF